MKHISLTFLALLFYCVSFAQTPAAITGPSGVCVGSSIALSDITPSGSWASGTTGVAIVGSASGVVTGIAPGLAVISYSVGSSYVTTTITVNPVPSAITGPSSICLGSASALTDAVGGGIWSSSVPAIATVGSATGIVTGVGVGFTTVTYTIATGCSVTFSESVITTPGPITGTPIVCVGSTTALADITGGGTWSSHSPAVATVSSAGIVGGTTAGTTIIDYGTGTCTASITVTVIPSPSAITGPSSVCTGASITETDATPGGVWSCSSSSIATITGGGIVYGLTPGTATISYAVSSGCAVSTVISIAVSPTPIAGPGSVCAGSTTTLTDAVAGGTWSSSATSVATVGIASGVVTGVAAGAAVISYTIATGCSVTASVVVNALPSSYSLTGGGGYCAGGSGSTIGLTGSSIGVSYQLYVGGTPWGSPVPGTGAAISFGSFTVAGTYTVLATDAVTACFSFMTGSVTVTVNPLPTVYSVTGGGSYCAGGTGLNVLLINSASGIDYQLYNGTTAVGTPLAGTGASLNFGLQTAAGSYTVMATDATTGCTNNMTGSATITVNPLPTITASSSSACGGIYTLTAGGGVTYSWSPSTGLSCATCATATTTPAATTAYTVTGTDAAGCSDIATTSVDGNRISGTITLGGTSTSLKVWLIQYNPSDSSITATDSTMACLSGGVPYYEFMDKAPGNYLAKAALTTSVPGTSDYCPTYSSSTPYWYAAASVAHAAATDNLNITMIYGTVPSGPGFISGYVYAGAGRGTTGDAPAAGMIIYLKDATTGNLLTYTYTDATGAYSFNALAYGSYVVYPEQYKDNTIASSVITLSAYAPSATGLNFRQYLDSKVIKPITVSGVKPVATAEGLNVFPNPTTGNLNITWSNQATGSADVIVTDMVGREVFRSVVNMGAASGKAQIDLTGLNNGIYMIAIKSANINYNGKLMKQE